MRARWQGSCLGAAAMLVLSVGIHAQSAGTVAPEDEYKQQIRVSEDIQPLGENPFGERVSLYTGELSFEQMDVDWKGIGLPIQVVRTFTPREDWFGFVDAAFVDWELSIPRITTLTADQQNVKGWVVRKLGSAGSSTARCTEFGSPPVVNAPPFDAAMSPWSPSQWWNGYQLAIPGQGSQDLLRRTSENSLAPSMLVN